MSEEYICPDCGGQFSERNTEADLAAHAAWHVRDAAETRQRRRDAFAAAALTAVIANDPDDTMTTEASASLAVRYADALLAAMDGTEGA